MENSGLFSSQVFDAKQIINLSKSGAISPTSKLKTSPTYKSSPLLKSFSSTKLGISPDEKNEEVLLKRRISKLTEKQFSIILEKAIDILRKPSEKRSLDDIFYLIKTTEKLDFFARMKKDKETEYFFNPNSMNFKCCKALKYEQFLKGETVFFQGDDADKFFIIIKGKVSVLLLKEQNILEKEKETLRKLRRNRKIPDYLKQYQSINSQKIEKNEKKDNAKQAVPQNNTETGITPFDQGLEIKKKFQKNISKVSNALLFLKTIEKSSETTKSEATLSALFPFASKISSETNKETPLIEKEKESTTIPNIRLDVSEQINSKNNNTLNKNCLIPGLNNQDLQCKDAFLDEGVFKYNLVSSLQTGDAFGELGIIRKKKRAATIVCLENTHLAVLMKKDYEAILLEEQTIKFKRLVDFFNKTLFKKCSNDRMTFIAYMYKKRKYIKDQWIFKEDEEPNECFIVKKGDIELSKTLKNKNKRGKVAILSENQFFGEEDILKKREKRLYNAKVLSVKATVFFISKQHFNKLLSEYKDLAFLFYQQAKNKEKFHINKIEQISQVLALKTKIVVRNKKKLRKKAPIRATLDQLNFICSEKKDLVEETPFLAFQNCDKKKNIILPKALRSPKAETQQNDKDLYYKETHQYSNVVRANQKTLKALLKKKINIFELYSETKNLHRHHELQYLNKRDRSKTQFFNEIAKEKSNITHNLQNLQNVDLACKERSDSVEFLNVFTPIRRNSDSFQDNTKDFIFKQQKTSFIKTYEYFCKTGQSQIKIEPNLHYRRLSLNLKTDSEEALKDCDQFLRGSSGNLKMMDSLNSQDNYFLRSEKNKQKIPKSIVILNHTGKPIKFSNN